MAEAQPSSDAPGEIPNGGPPPARRKPRVRNILIIFGVVAAFVGWRYYVYTLTWVTTDDAAIDGHVTDVSARVNGYVQRLLVEDNQLVAPGTVLVELDAHDFEALLALARANLQSGEAALGAARTNVDLVKITAQANLDAAAASLQSAKLAVATAETQVAATQSALEQKKAALVSARAMVSAAHADAVAAEALQEQARQDWERYKELIENKLVPSGNYAVTRQQVEHAEQDYKAAAAQWESAKKKADSSQAQVAVAEADVNSATVNVAQARAQLAEAQGRVAEAQARLAAADIVPQQIALSQSQAAVAEAAAAQFKAAVRTAELNLSYTKIVAAEAGRVTHRTVEAGEQVQPGQALLSLVSANLWVTANLKETQLTHVRPGQPAEIDVDAFPGKVFKGRVDSIQAGTGARFSLLPPENATGYFVKVVQRVPVKIVFDEPAQELLNLSPGMSVVPAIRVRGQESEARAK